MTTKNETEIETTYVGFRVTPKFKELMQEYILKDTHTSLSEFIRSAIREKIKRDYPNLMKRLFSEEDSS